MLVLSTFVRWNVWITYYTLSSFKGEDNSYQLHYCKCRIVIQIIDSLLAINMMWNCFTDSEGEQMEL